MKKSPFSSLFATVFLSFLTTLALLAVTTPVSVKAQPYYGNYSYYGNQSLVCLNLTAYQAAGSTDAYTGGQVSQLQEFLNQTGYLSGVSGTYDSGTVGAVINYQQAHGLPITGSLTPATIYAINQQSCGGIAYGNSYSSYPVTSYANGSNCYWTGGTYNSTYICSNTPVAPIVPVVPVYVAPVVCNNWNNNYNYGANYYNPNGCNSLAITSLSASYGYNTTTITINGYGFSPAGNTVTFGNTVIAGTYSSNGSTITFAVPSGYYSGTYGVSVRNAQGITSNTLSFVLNNNSYGTNYWNNGYNNNWNNGYINGNTTVTLSNISGPSNVYPGSLNVWTVTATGSNGGYTSISANWGDYNTYGSTNNTQQSYSSGSQTFSFSHVYQTPGTYTLRITATSGNGATTYATYLVTVSNNGNNYYYP